jgi:hypothetical protein
MYGLRRNGSPIMVITGMLVDIGKPRQVMVIIFDRDTGNTINIAVIYGLKANGVMENTMVEDTVKEEEINRMFLNNNHLNT